MNLNVSQKAVADTRARRTLAVAGAGTGKTASATNWVAGLVADGVQPGNILMLTFTRKAGEEMRKRAKALIEKLGIHSGGADGLAVGTYHSVAVRLMRKDPLGFGLRLDGRFTILDSDDVERIWRSALKGAGVDRPQGPWVPSRMAAIVSKSLNWCRNPENRFVEIFRDKNDQQAAVQAYRSFVGMKKDTNCVDFDDLLVFWARRLKQDPGWRERLRNKWQYVLVDEFQDNNPLNAEIIRRLDPHHLLVVGDGNQTIYGFRGADPSIMGKFKVEHADAVVLLLEDNYRSGQNILDLGNKIVAQSVMPLELKSGRGTQGVVEYRVYPNQAAETDAVVSFVRSLIGQRVEPAEICVLSRSSFVFNAIEVALKHRGLEYKKYGGMTLGDAAETKDLISFLRIVHNPRDQAAWMRALVQFPKMGEKGAMNFLGRYPNGEIPDDAWPKHAHRMRDWIKHLKETPALGDKLDFLAKNIPDLIEANYKENAADRIRNIHSISEGERGSSRSLSEFLDSYSTEKFGSKEHPGGHITLSTIHSAKGLEWNYVWLVGVGSFQLPHIRCKTDEERKEELRLAYVAVTRARDHLVCSYPESLPNGAEQDPCPFFPEDSPWQCYDDDGRPRPRRQVQRRREEYAMSH